MVFEEGGLVDATISKPSIHVYMLGEVSMGETTKAWVVFGACFLKTCSA